MNGLDVRWKGLCAFACEHNECPSQWCNKIAYKGACNPPVPGDPNVPKCISGARPDTIWDSMCQFTCKYNFCPPEVCDCLVAGPTALPKPPVIAPYGRPIGEEDYDLCKYSCAWGFCPSDACKKGSGSGSTTTGGGSISTMTTQYMSPAMATIVPLPNLSLRPTETLTLGPGIASDVGALGNSGNQNVPRGPGANECAVRNTTIVDENLC